MKSLIFAAALIAVASAGRILPGGAGPAPIVPGPAVVGPVLVEEYEPINVGPAIVDEYEPINVGPALVEEYEPISVGPAIVGGYEPISVGPVIVDHEVNGVKTPLVQIILNINSLGQVDVSMPSPINPEPVIVVDGPENPIDDIQVIDVNPVPVEIDEVKPVQVGTPVLPSPVITLPDGLN